MKLRMFAPALIFLAGLPLACGKAKPAETVEPLPVADLSGKFVFEPNLGTVYQHTMKRTESFEIVGTEAKSLEQWEAVWAMSITPSGEDYVYGAELESLRLEQNGAPLLLGPEVQGRGGKLEIIMDSQGRLLDVQKTETLTRAVVEAAPPEAKPGLAAMFSPERLRMLFALRVIERVQDLIGQSARVGASWAGTAPGPDGGPVAEKLLVDSSEDCGEIRCVKVVRTLMPDRGRVWGGAEQRVREFVRARGGDDQSVELLGVEVNLADELVVDPRTMEFHRARFEQSSELQVKTATGEYQVRTSTVRESSYRY